MGFKIPVTLERRSSQERVISNIAHEVLRVDTTDRGALQEALRAAVAGFLRGNMAYASTIKWLIDKGAHPENISVLDQNKRAVLMKLFDSGDHDLTYLGLIYAYLFENTRLIPRQYLGMPTHAKVNEAICRLYKEYPGWGLFSWRIEGMVPFDEAVASLPKALFPLQKRQKESLLNALEILEQRTQKGTYLFLDASEMQKLGGKSRFIPPLPFILIKNGCRVVLIVIQGFPTAVESSHETFLGAAIDLIGPRGSWRMVALKRVRFESGNLPAEFVHVSPLTTCPEKMEAIFLEEKETG
ncbi:MAG: hypothetical protein A3F09_02800 [Chlamydiae bacterium RIFCSPHIGHO2_12_FULL_49_11]|nr:MAG: hypothetical protein A3F09_02800 [Chlamydiae bacterium RIFCSPHIGHO2_12_FULL_49_11]